MTDLHRPHAGASRHGAPSLSPPPTGHDGAPPRAHSAGAAGRADRGPHVAGRARWAVWLPPAVAALLAAVLLASRMSYVPVWDGRVYADCVVRAANALPASLLSRCAGHPSQAYIGVLALVQRLHPGSPALLIAGNAALLALLAIAFARVLRRIFPAAELAPERAWLLAALLVHPVLLAGVVQPGLDLGACVFLVCALAALLEGRVWPTVAFGLLASFSKESGALLYAVLVGVYALTLGAPRPRPPRVYRALLGALLATLLVGRFASRVRGWWGPTLGDRWGLIALAAGGLVFLLLCPRPRPLRPALHAIWRWARPLLPLGIPPLALGGYLLLVGVLRPQYAVLWQGEAAQSVTASLVNPQMGPTQRSYLALLLILGFLWVPTAFVALDAGVGLMRWRGTRAARAVAGANAALLSFVSLFTVAAVFVLTRYVTFANARYLLPAYVLTLVVFGAALLRLGLAPRWRQTALAAVAALFALSAERTLDPVSRALWGVFPVGRHDFLRVASFTGECCGYGRDQLAYNLQFTAFDPLVQAALDRVRASGGGALAMDTLANWNLVGPLDAAGRRTLRASGREPRVLPAGLLEKQPSLPARAWFFVVPYLCETNALTATAQHYQVGRPDTVWAGGYAIELRPLARRAGEPRAESPRTESPRTESPRTARASAARGLTSRSLSGHVPGRAPPLPGHCPR